jgi:nucleobase:cation symporter-1, NCS1 family
MNFSTLALRQRSLANKVKTRLTKPPSWALPKESSNIAPDNVWSNADQDPVPVEKRTWTAATFAMY